MSQGCDSHLDADSAYTRGGIHESSTPAKSRLSDGREKEMATNDRLADLVIRRGRSGLSAIIAATALVVGFGAVGQPALASADGPRVIHADPHSEQARTANPADQAPLPPPVEMKAVPTVKATPYWGEKNS